MKKKSILSFFATILCIVSSHAFSKTFPNLDIHKKAINLKSNNYLPPYTYDLDAGFEIQQNVNEKGLVIIEGNFTKPFTSDNIKLSVKYQNAQGNWVVGWCKILYSYNQYNERLKASFELPASVVTSYNVKIELSSDTNLSNFNSVAWEKFIKHYKFGDYTSTDCDLDENEYTILLTPKKEGTLIINANGKVTGVKDRVTSAYSWNKIYSVLMDNKKNDVVFSPKNPATLIDVNGVKSINMQGVISDTLGSTPQLIYNEGMRHPMPYLYSYDDPVYMFAGKFSINGFLMKFSQWPGDSDGPGYHNFKNPTQLESRYFNLYNSIHKKLSDFMTDQEPIVIVSSLSTGFRIYKNNGAFIDLTPDTTSNYGVPRFGYTNSQGNTRRGPGSENFSITNSTEMTLYGMGALRNNVSANNYQTVRSISDIEKEISKFIKYTGIFGTTSAYDDTSECALGCYSVNPGAISDYNVLDWSKAPNSYVFDPNLNNSGLYIPVKKAYAMWQNDKFIGGSSIPSGTIIADVLWEDEHGLIKSGTNYSLEIIGTVENAKIKVPVNKSKKGNAVIAFKVDGVIYWSWHIWVTDDPTNGSTYKSFANVKRERNDGTIELIPDSDWKWMDRNLGAMGSSLTSNGWTRNGGLLYQWGRKDPVPPLVAKGGDSYEVSGSRGRVRHYGSQAFTNTDSLKLNNLRKFVLLSNATVKNNISLSIKNPLSLIYVNKDDNSGLAPSVNWFGKYSGLVDSRLTELNLWSDNSKGIINNNYNSDEGAAPYRDKSAYDPCPNGWRIPSMLVANEAGGDYINNIRIDFSPFGVRTNMGKNTFEANGYHIIKPNDTNVPVFMKGIKLQLNIGFDMSNVGGNNMGVFPGTGQLNNRGEYTDQHHVGLWTSTMTRFFDTTPATGARMLYMLPDGGQPDIPDSSFPNITGRYFYEPLATNATMAANACRCLRDPLYVVDKYDFPTEFFNEVEFTDGLYNPNTYTKVKSSAETAVEIPINKAFSVQSQLLNNPNVLNSSNYNNLKVNVLWSTNVNMIKQIYINQPSPTSLSEINNSKIIVAINPNQSGNAVVTLHNGSIANPVYWSWHVWITNSEIKSISYTTDVANPDAPNYINYAKGSAVLNTEIMDRNIGAIESFPTINGDNLNPETSQPGSVEQIMLAGGLHYQWGRKDPIPTYKPASVNDYTDKNGVRHYYKTGAVKYYLGTVAANGSITYVPLSESSYNSNYIKAYNTYSNSINANVLSSDKPFEKIAKVISYSVKNPLAYMVPSTFSPYTSEPNGTGRYSNGSDWLSTEPNLAADRWGRGGEKSPYDPCPEGWRIPDLTAVENTAVYGISPWYKKGLPVSNAFRSTQINYSGTRIRLAKNYTSGITFNNSAYQTGNYPIFIGTRGHRSVEVNSVPDFTVSNGQYTTYWTAALNSNFRGRPIGLLFQNSSTEAQNYFFAYHDNNDPYFGAACRCVKVKYDQNGNEEGAIPRLSVMTITQGRTIGVLTTSLIEKKIIQHKLEFFPNPVKNFLYIKGNDKVKDYYYQVYDLSGKLVKSGKFINEQTDLSSLVAGGYLLKINNSEKIIKIIKE